VNADYIPSALLALVNHWNQQTDGKSKTAVHADKPPEYLEAATEIEKENSIRGNEPDLRDRDSIRIFGKLDKTERHFSDPIRKRARDRS